MEMPVSPDRIVEQTVARQLGIQVAILWALHSPESSATSLAFFFNNSKFGFIHISIILLAFHLDILFKCSDPIRLHFYPVYLFISTKKRF